MSRCRPSTPVRSVASGTHPPGTCLERLNTKPRCARQYFGRCKASSPDAYARPACRLTMPACAIRCPGAPTLAPPKRPATPRTPIDARSDGRRLATGGMRSIAVVHCRRSSESSPILHLHHLRRTSRLVHLRPVAVRRATVRAARSRNPHPHPPRNPHPHPRGIAAPHA